ncbi:MAG TPA: hypothetical protein VLL97_03075 [Acidobacteriota bacterium]|nr:hypothetical protein [Acidobacteriota bacterium]
MNIFQILKFAGLTATFILMKSELLRRIYSNETSIVFHYDLSDDINVPEPSIPINLRPLVREDDIFDLLVRHSGIADNMELKTRIECLLFLGAGIPTCFGGFTENGKLVVINCLITPAMNDRLRDYFKDGVNLLAADEVLCEFVFTHRDYRGLRLHQWSTLELFKKAKESGAVKALAYINIKNEKSLCVNSRFGWKPFLVKKVIRRMFRRKITFIPYHEGDMTEIHSSLSRNPHAGPACGCR